MTQVLSRFKKLMPCDYPVLKDHFCWVRTPLTAFCPATFAANSVASDIEYYFRVLEHTLCIVEARHRKRATLRFPIQPVGLKPVDALATVYHENAQLPWTQAEPVVGMCEEEFVSQVQRHTLLGALLRTVRYRALSEFMYVTHELADMVGRARHQARQNIRRFEREHASAEIQDYSSVSHAIGCKSVYEEWYAIKREEYGQKFEIGDNTYSLNLMFLGDYLDLERFALIENGEVIGYAAVRIASPVVWQLATIKMRRYVGASEWFIRELARRHLSVSRLNFGYGGYPGLIHFKRKLGPCAMLPTFGLDFR